MLKFFLSFLILSTGTMYSFGANALPPMVEGRVFDDRNQNGRMDKSEPGIANVLVSDGRAISRTDVQGRWQLTPTEASIVFVIKPDGWQVPMDADGLPDFWIDLHSEKVNRGIHFALRKNSRKSSKNKLDMLVFGDPQPKNSRDVGYYEKDIVEPLIGKTQAELGISLGDIVHGNLALYPAMNKVTRRLNTPWLHVSGNHDRDEASTLSDEQSLLTFSSYYGPDTFAWEQSGTSIIVLDDVIHKPNSGTPAAYVGGLRESQFQFLHAYLDLIPKNRRVILAMHIPVFDSDANPKLHAFRDQDRQRLFSLLSGFENVLLLTAHSHMQRHFFHDEKNGWHGKTPLHEFNVGAACGAFWTGIKDADGIPDALMQDGTPNGFARLSWSEAAAPKLSWHAARASSDKQMQLFAPKVLRHKSYPGFGVFANVFMGMSDTVVEYRVDGFEWRPMLRVETLDPSVLSINMADAASDHLRSYDLMSEAMVSTHLWRGALPTNLSPGKHLVEVRAKLNDQWFNDSLVYELQQAEP